MNCWLPDGDDGGGVGGGGMVVGERYVLISYFKLDCLFLSNLAEHDIYM